MSSRKAPCTSGLRRRNLIMSSDAVTATVVAGARYRFTAYVTGGFRFGLATVATDGNVRWVCPIYRSIEITIPQGYTTLHYTTDTNSALGFLVELIQ